MTRVPWAAWASREPTVATSGLVPRGGGPPTVLAVLGAVRRAGAGGADVAAHAAHRLVVGGLVGELGGGHAPLVLAAVRRRRALVERVPAPHLAAEHVDVVVQRLRCRVRRGVGELHRLVDASHRLLVDPRAVILGDD